MTLMLHERESEGTMLPRMRFSQEAEEIFDFYRRPQSSMISLKCELTCTLSGHAFCLIWSDERVYPHNFWRVNIIAPRTS